MEKVDLRRYFRHGMLPQLLAFEACIRHGSVTRAANELSLAQPTVSCLIKKLSITMGGALTTTRDRRIEPTALGEEVLGLCRDVREALARFESARGGMIVRNADRLFINNDRGELIIVKPSPDGYQEISRTNLIKPTSPPQNPRRGSRESCDSQISPRRGAGRVSGWKAKRGRIRRSKRRCA